MCAEQTYGMATIKHPMSADRRRLSAAVETVLAVVSLDMKT